MLADTALLEQVAVRTAEGHFNDDYKTPENFESRKREGLGCAIAHYCSWDGIKIMQIFEAALEDANFHTECAQVTKMIERVKES